MTLGHVYASIALTPTGKQIRLLSIRPSESHEDRSLCIELQLASLDDEYTALSYCWGDEKLRKTCTINGVETSVTANLAAVLYQLRAEGKTNGSCKLWIDAICINQLDTNEKAHQVGMMGDIYAHAEKTMIWLGESGDDSDLVMDLLASIETSGQGHFDNYSTANESPVWQALRIFLRRQWWSRAWIIQEAILSKESLLKCGAKQVDFNSLIQLKILHEKNVYTRSEQFRMIRELWSECPLGNLLYDDLQKFVGKGLSAWFTDMGSFQCKHLRDKLYALLGLVSPQAKEMVLRDITIEYNEEIKSDRQIVIEAAIVCFHEEGLLMLQMRQTGKTPSLELPSWTPDWTTTAPHGAFTNHGFDAFPRNCKLELPGPEQWARQDAYNKRFMYLPDHEALLFHGFKVDIVDFVSVMPEVPVYTGQDANLLTESKLRRAELTKETCRNWESEVLTNKKDSYNGIGQEGCAEAFYRTIIANQNWDRQPIESTLRPVFDVWQNRQLSSDMISASEAERNAYTQDYRFCTIVRCARRSFITTKNGYFGLAPPNTEIGDYVCLLYSGAVAYILRPNPPGVDKPGKFVGEAYIHGIMNGEYLKESNLSTWSGFWVN